MVPKTDEIIERANSKQPLTTYSPNRITATVYPDFSHRAVLEMVNKEPVARGALNHFVDKCMEGNFAVITKEGYKYDRAFQLKLLRDYKFRTNVLRKIFLMGKMYNNVFLEIIFDSNNSAKEINVLDTTAVEAITKPNGDLLSLRSTNPNPETGKHATWDEREIVWIKFNDISKGYAPVDLQALWETILVKDYVRQYVAWLWRTGQYRLMYNFKNTSDQDVLDFITYLKKHDGNFQVPFMVKGEIETKILRDIKEIDSIDRLFKYLDNQILIALRIPPNDAGIPDASGRSNADAQSNNLITHVTAWKHIVADSISYDLFPKISKGNTIFRFTPADRFAERQVLENLQIMSSIGMSKDLMQKYLIKKGLVFDVEEYFEPIHEPLEQEADKPFNPRDQDTNMSRMGKEAGTGNQAQSEPTTREDQLHGNK